MLTYQYTVIMERDEDGYHAYAPTLRGCHTWGATLDEALTNIKEAMELYIAGFIEHGEQVPVEEEPFVITRVTVSV